MPTAAKRYRPHGASTCRDHTHNSHQRGYTKAWYAQTVPWLMEQIAIDPTCRLCGKVPVISQESMSRKKRRPYQVDHRIAPSSAGPVGSPAYERLFWDSNNWQVACEDCNSSKQNRIDQ